MLKNLFRKMKEGEKGEELSFYQQLEDDFYNEYPEDWGKEPLHAVGLRFVAILEGRTDRVNVPRYRGGTTTHNYIKRGKRKLWVVGDVYEVSPGMNTSSKDELLERMPSGMEKRQFSQTIGPKESVGSIMLTKIIPGESEDTLIFKVA